MSQAAPAEKIQKIVHEITQLNILEVAELNQLLKTTLNIPDTPMMAYGAPAAAGPAAPKEVILYPIHSAIIQNLFPIPIISGRG